MTIFCETDPNVRTRPVFTQRLIDTLKSREIDLHQRSALEVRSPKEFFGEPLSKEGETTPLEGRGKNDQHNDRGSCP
jgi:hypothetical protein